MDNLYVYLNTLRVGHFLPLFILIFPYSRLVLVLDPPHLACPSLKGIGFTYLEGAIYSDKIPLQVQYACTYFSAHRRTCYNCYATAPSSSAAHRMVDWENIKSHIISKNFVMARLNLKFHDRVGYLWCRL